MASPCQQRTISLSLSLSLSLVATCANVRQHRFGQRELLFTKRRPEHVRHDDGFDHALVLVESWRDERREALRVGHVLEHDLAVLQRLLAESELQ